MEQDNNSKHMVILSVLTWMLEEGWPGRRSSGGRQHPVLQTTGWHSSGSDVVACYQLVL